MRSPIGCTRARRALSELRYAPPRADAEVGRELLELDSGDSPTPVAPERRDGDWRVTFYQFPEVHWTHLRTTNMIESPFHQVRSRTNAARRYKRARNNVG